jgi:autotransporter strand-loop-strand O-heptosyltransferase
MDGSGRVAMHAEDAPSQAGPGGVRFDFNDGCRVRLPDGHWRVRLSDLDTGNLLYDTRIGAGQVNSAKRFFVRFRLEVDGADGEKLVHDYDASGRDVLIKLDVDSLGDTIAWFAQAAAFQRQHRCQLTCAMSAKLIPLFRDAYPEIAFVSHDAVPRKPFYASYRPILYFNDSEHRYQPSDYQQVGLHRNAAEILGIAPVETPPAIALPTGLGPFAEPPTEPYVCIASQSTTQSKYWNNPHGWLEIVRFLKDSGYRVICIDQKPVHGQGLVWNHIPHGAEDLTGDRPLLERAQWLRQAACFVGLSSGLSWLAWAVGTPVVMISGFTHPGNEFATPYRVINYHACNSCFNDVRVAFDRNDFLWCPRHAGTPRQFECTRLITAAQVKAALRRIPGFAPERDQRLTPPCVAAKEIVP